MTGFNSLVVGFDSSDRSADALRWAIDHLSEGGSLHVVHAVDPAGSAIRRSEQERAVVRENARRMFEGQWIEAARRDCPGLQTHLADDGAAETLLRVANETGAAAVVVGAHGTSTARLVLGSVTSKLLHHSKYPLIVIADYGDDAPTKTQDSQVIACVGYGEATDRAAQWAADYAVSSDLTLALTHIIGYRPIFPAASPGDVLASYFGPGFGRKWAQIGLDDMAAELKKRLPNLTVMTQVKFGSVTRQISKASTAADLVVLGKRHSNPASRWIISPKVHRMLTRSIAPIAIIPSCIDH